MLIGNGARLTSNPMRQYCGVGVTNDMHVPLPSTGSLRNTRALYGKLASLPRGTQPPYSWLMSFKSGDMISYGEVSGRGLVTLGLSMGINLTGSTTGSGDINPGLSALAHILSSITGSGDITTATASCNANLDAATTGQGSITTADSTLLTYCTAALEGQGTLTPGDLQLIVGMIADLTGSGNLSGAMSLLTFLAASLTASGDVSTATLETMAQLTASLQAGGDVTTAQLDCLAWFALQLDGSGEASATIESKCFMDAEISSTGELVTAQSCAQAVWEALNSSYNTEGTMGYSVSHNTGGGGWDELIHDMYQEGTAGYMLDKIYYKKEFLNRR